jgi:hypothetical protein
MLDERWPETESGTVVRSYFHARGAAREMETAQREGWTVQEVKLNGSVVPEPAQTKWWRRQWKTRLVRKRDGTVQLRTAGSADAVWGSAGARGQDIEVTYVR